MDRVRFRDWVSSIDELTATRLPARRCPGCQGAQARPVARAGTRRSAHPDGHQPPPLDQGFPAVLPRHRDQVSRQLPQMVPSRCVWQTPVAESLSRSGQRQDKPAIHELRLFWNNFPDGLLGNARLRFLIFKTALINPPVTMLLSAGYGARPVNWESALYASWRCQ